MAHMRVRAMQSVAGGRLQLGRSRPVSSAVVAAAVVVPAPMQPMQLTSTLEHMLQGLTNCIWLQNERMHAALLRAVARQAAA